MSLGLISDHVAGGLAQALRWTAAGMMEATKGFRRLKAHKLLPTLKAALAAHQAKQPTQQKFEEEMEAA